MNNVSTSIVSLYIYVSSCKLNVRSTSCYFVVQHVRLSETIRKLITTPLYNTSRARGVNKWVSHRTTTDIKINFRFVDIMLKKPLNTLKHATWSINVLRSKKYARISATVTLNVAHIIPWNLACSLSDDFLITWFKTIYFTWRVHAQYIADSGVKLNYFCHILQHYKVVCVRTSGEVDSFKPRC